MIPGENAKLKSRGFFEKSTYAVTSRKLVYLRKNLLVRRGRLKVEHDTKMKTLLSSLTSRSSLKYKLDAFFSL